MVVAGFAKMGYGDHMTGVKGSLAILTALAMAAFALPANAGASKATDEGSIPSGMIRCWNGQLAPIKRSYDDPPVCPPIPESKQCSRPTVQGPDGLMHCPEDVQRILPPPQPAKPRSPIPVRKCWNGTCDPNPYQDTLSPPEWAGRAYDAPLSPHGAWAYGVFV